MACEIDQAIAVLSQNKVTKKAIDKAINDNVSILDGLEDDGVLSTEQDLTLGSNPDFEAMADEEAQLQEGVVQELNKNKPKLGNTPIKVTEVYNDGTTTRIMYKYPSGREYGPISIKSITLDQKNALEVVRPYTEVRNRVLGSNGTGSFQKKVENLKKNALKDRESMKAVIEQLPEVDAGYKKYILGLIDLIDPKFLPELSLYVNTDAAKTAGIVNNTEIIIDVKGDTTTVNDGMSAVEVYGHELMHAITKFAVESPTEEASQIVQQLELLRDAASKVVEWQDFMPKQSLDKAADEKEARKRWNYIFRGNNSLHEFIAYGMTNPVLMQKLKANKVKKQKEDLSLFAAIKQWWGNLLDVVLGNTSFDQVGKSMKKNLHQLTFDLMQSNNTAINVMQENKGVLSDLSELIDKLGNKPLSNMIEKSVKWMKGNEYEIEEYPGVDSSRLEKIVYIMKFMPKLLSRKDFRGIREIVLTSIGMSPEGFVQNVIRDVQDPDKLERLIEKLEMASGQIDRARELTVKMTGKEIEGAFSRKLTKVEEESLTLSGLDVDLSGIYKQYGRTEIVKMLTDAKKRKERIGVVKTQLARLDRKNFKWNSNQATGLGYYLATHQAGKAQNLNAYGIASKVLTNHRIQANKKVVDKIDELATLVGIDYTSSDSNSLLADLIKSEGSGVDYVMSLNEGIKKEARQLFGSEINIIKGYSKELVDNTISARVAPISDIYELEREGYELVETLSKDEKDDSKKQMGLFVMKTYVNNSYNRAATRMTNMIKKGTTLTDIAFKTENSLQAASAKNAIKKMKIEAAKEVELMETGEFVPSAGDRLVPLLNEFGDVVDYRYMMGKSTKKKYLNQDTTVTEVLGRTAGSIGDKLDTATQNEAVLDLILKDQEQNYDPKNSQGANGRLYVRIEESSPNKQIKEVFQLLPANMKQAIKDKGKGGYIAVRRDMLSNYFGFRDATVTDFFGIHNITPEIWIKWIKIAEQMWADIVAISKVDIVIRVPAVFIGNIISNFMYSVIGGANPLKVAKMQLQNVKHITRYVERVKEIEQLKVQGRAGKKGTAKSIKLIEHELTRNPVHVLMKAGMYQAIVEDLERSDERDSNKVAQFISEKTETLPEFVKNGANMLYLNSNTKYFQFITKATQYSDFVARATEYQILIGKGVKEEVALTTVLDAFVNYGKPASSFEEYLNNMGLIMFTKYFKRIQRVIRTQGTEKPMNVLLSILGQEWLLEVDNIQDQNIFSKSYRTIGINPLEHLSNAFTPSAFQYLGVMK